MTRRDARIDSTVLARGIDALARDQGIASGVEVRGLRALRGGNSSEIWRFEGRWSEESSIEFRPLILRRGLDNEFALGGREAEFVVLRAVAESHYPAPRVYWYDATGRHLGRPGMVMQHCAGRSDRLALSDRDPFSLGRERRLELAQDMLALLARLHAIDPRVATTHADTFAPRSAEDELDALDRAIVALEAEPMIELRVASWWLWQHLPPPPHRTTIVHGDFRPSNVLIDAGCISAVLDWEFTHIGDPLEDLGWYVTPYYRAEHTLPGAWEVGDIVSRYEALSGAAVHRGALEFWSVFAMYKLAYMTIAALRWAADGDATRLGTSSSFILRPLLTTIASRLEERGA